MTSFIIGCFVLIAVMAVVGVSAMNIAIACAMSIAGVALMILGDQLVERLTGRKSADPTENYKAVGLCVTLLIGLPPIFLLPDPHPLVVGAFQIVGMTIGGIVAQSSCGKRHDPAELNRKMSAAVQAAAEEKLGRPLTPDEEYRIWNLGSFLGLDAVDRAVFYAESPADVETYLSGLPKRDPLPEEYTRRF